MECQFADFSDDKILNNIGFIYIFIIFDNFSKFFWCIPPKNKNTPIITNEFSNILTSSNECLKKSGRGKAFYKSICQNFLTSKNIHHVSKFTDKEHRIAEGVN